MDEKLVEKIFVDKTEEFLKTKGFQTYREVIPIECQDWEQPYRVDLIFFREDIGYIGVEFKVMKSWRSGSTFAEAIEQIQKYQKLSYFENKKIQRWCICGKERNDREDDNDLRIFVQTFLKKKYDIDLFEFLEYPSNPEWNRIVIGSNQKNSITIGKARQELFEFV